MCDSPSSYSFVETLKDRRKYKIRAARPDDAPKIHRAFYQLGPRTRYMRFLAVKKDVSEAELARITHTDFQNSIALLATVGEGNSEVIIGGASYFVIDPAASERSAEVSFTVEEDFQGLGLGRALMRHVIAIARAEGLHTLQAEVLCSNAAMLSVFRHCGQPMESRQDGNVLHVTLSLLD